MLWLTTHYMFRCHLPFRLIRQTSHPLHGNCFTIKGETTGETLTHTTHYGLGAGECTRDQCLNWVPVLASHNEIFLVSECRPMRFPAIWLTGSGLKCPIRRNLTLLTCPNSYEVTCQSIPGFSLFSLLRLRAVGPVDALFKHPSICFCFRCYCLRFTSVHRYWCYQRSHQPLFRHGRDVDASRNLSRLSKFCYRRP